jgi:uncharacterized protein (TIGR03083 family)
VRAPEPILVAALFAPVNDELVALLRGLAAGEWNARTAAPAWTVKDVASHLLDTTLRRLSMHRDGYLPQIKDDALAGGLTRFIDDLNAEWVSVSRRLSPAQIIDMHERYGRQMADFMTTLDPFSSAPIGVSWAGEATSLNWFDTARELTEKWHHQQQIRDAVGRPPLYEARYLRPVIDTFMRALPFTYRNVEAPFGTEIVVQVDEDAWTIVRDERWTLFAGAGDTPATTITMTADTAWRLMTKGLKRAEAAARSQVQGDRKYADAAFGMLAIVG